MAQDRYTKAVLTVLALGVWALALVQAGTPAVLAEVVDVAASVDTPARPAALEGTNSGAPPATYPLRWYMPLVMHQVEGGAINCNTTIAVVNPNTSSVNVEIEFFSDSGSVLGGTKSSAVAANSFYYVSTEDMNPDYPNTGPDVTMVGHARVYADNPNILAVNQIGCNNGDYALEPFAVGATLDLFSAGNVRLEELTGVAVAER